MNEDTKDPNMEPVGIIIPTTEDKVAIVKPGDRGAEYPPHARQEQALVAQAVREGWDFKPGERREVIQDQLDTIRQHPSVRARQNAAKILLLADGKNIAREGLEIRRAALETISAALVTPEALERQEEALKALLIDVKLPTE